MSRGAEEFQFLDAIIYGRLKWISLYVLLGNGYMFTLLLLRRRATLSQGPKDDSVNHKENT